MVNKRLIVLTALIVSLLLGLGFSLVLWRQRRQRPMVATQLPSLPPVEIVPRVPQATVSAYTLRASLPAVESLPVYQYFFPFDSAQGEPKSRAISWARNLGFAGEPEEINDALRGALYLWSTPGQTLIIDYKASQLSYSVDLLADPQTLSGSFLPNFEQAAVIVERTLLDLVPESKLLKLAPQKSRALRVGVSRVHRTSLAEADLVEVHFTAAVDSYPLYTGAGPDQDPVVAWVGRDGKLLRLEFQVVGSLGERLGDYPLKDREEIIADLNAGRGVVVSSDLVGGETLDSVTITRISLGYLLPSSDANTLQPVFILKSPKLVLYLPAVKD